jgi:hypothetical protein
MRAIVGMVGLTSLVLAGCGPRELSASMTIDGADVVVEGITPSGSLSGARDGLLIRLADGRRFAVDFPRGARGELGVARERDGRDGFRATWTEPPVSDILFELCQTDASTEGTLVVRETSHGSSGFLDHVDGTLRVRFAGCDATYEGVAQSDLEFVIELPSRM